MGIYAWNYVDAVALLAQVYLLISWANGSGLPLSKKLGYLLAGWLLIAPISIVPVAITPIWGVGVQPPVLRAAFWHIKISSLSSNDCVIVLCFSYVMFRAALGGLGGRRAAVATWALILVFMLGLASLTNAVHAVYWKNIFRTVRVLMILLTCLLGVGLPRRKAGDFLFGYARVLTLISLVGIASFALLSESYKVWRYVLPASLPNQCFQIPMLIFGAFYVFSENRSRWSLSDRALGVSCVTLSIVLLYKSSVLAMSAVLVVAFVRRLRRVRVAEGKWTERLAKLSVPAFALISSAVVFAGSLWLGISAITTRLIMVANVVLTLKSIGPLGWLFGLGWMQWYRVIIPFPFVDYGAWTPDQLSNPYYRYADQVPFWPLVQSIGIVGALIVIILVGRLFVRCFRSYAFVYQNRWLAFFIVAICATGFLSLPEGLPASLALESAILFAIYKARIYRVVKRRYRAGEGSREPAAGLGGAA